MLRPRWHSPLWIFVAALLWLSSGHLADVWAQQERVLETQPQGSYVTLRGPLELYGTAPLSLSELPYGEYMLTGEGPGLEFCRTRVLYGENGLSSRGYARATSLVVPPGLVHLVLGEMRGLYFLGAGLGSGAFIYLTWEEVRDADDRLAKARANLETAGSDYERAWATLGVQNGQAELDHARTTRNLWLIYGAANWLGASLEAWLLTPQPTLGSSGPGQHLVGLPSAGTWGPALRSALVPGSGQRALGHSGRASFFSTMFGVTAGASIFANDLYLNAWREEETARGRLALADSPAAIREATSALESAKSKTESRNILRWGIFATTAYFYLWNIYDAYVTGTRAQEEGEAFSMNVVPTMDGAYATLSWRFD